MSSRNGRSDRLRLARRHKLRFFRTLLDGLEFPVLVLDAYYRAQLGAAERYPQCELTWNQLAGIGRVETVHGTYGGSAVQVDGEVVPPILGVVLDGSRFSAIPDTDGGRLDGNTQWDRAVGPMQFIPSSWEIYGADGNEDGTNDPHNLYDAAAAAGNHLCRGHSGLQAPDAFTASLLGYNHSPAYGVAVRGYADLYASRLDLSPDNRPEPEGDDPDGGDPGGEESPAPVTLAASDP